MLAVITPSLKTAPDDVKVVNGDTKVANGAVKVVNGKRKDAVSAISKFILI